MAPGFSPSARAAADELERLKWFLWHGNAFRALQVIGDLKIDLDVEDPTPRQRKLYKALAEFEHYIQANAAWNPNYGERYRCGEAISNAFVESAVNQIISKRMVKNNRCAGQPAERTSCSRSAPKSSTTISTAPSNAGTQDSCQQSMSSPSRREPPTVCPALCSWIRRAQ